MSAFWHENPVYYLNRFFLFLIKDLLDDGGEIPIVSNKSTAINLR